MHFSGPTSLSFRQGYRTQMSHPHTKQPRFFKQIWGSILGMKYRVYLVISRKSGTAYIGKGPDGRIEGEHNMEFHSLMKRSDMAQ